MIDPLTLPHSIFKQPLPETPAGVKIHRGMDLIEFEREPSHKVSIEITAFIFENIDYSLLAKYPKSPSQSGLLLLYLVNSVPISYLFEHVLPNIDQSQSQDLVVVAIGKVAWQNAASVIGTPKVDITPYEHLLDNRTDLFDIDARAASYTRALIKCGIEPDKAARYALLGTIDSIKSHIRSNGGRFIHINEDFELFLANTKSFSSDEQKKLLGVFGLRFARCVFSAGKARLDERRNGLIKVLSVLKDINADEEIEEILKFVKTRNGSEKKRAEYTELIQRCLDGLPFIEWRPTETPVTEATTPFEIIAKEFLVSLDVENFALDTVHDLLLDPPKLEEFYLALLKMSPDVLDQSYITGVLTHLRVKENMNDSELESVDKLVEVIEKVVDAIAENPYFALRSGANKEPKSILCNQDHCLGAIALLCDKDIVDHKDVWENVITEASNIPFAKGIGISKEDVLRVLGEISPTAKQVIIAAHTPAGKSLERSGPQPS